MNDQKKLKLKSWGYFGLILVMSPFMSSPTPAQQDYSKIDEKQKNNYSVQKLKHDSTFGLEDSVERTLLDVKDSDFESADMIIYDQEPVVRELDDVVAQGYDF
ncbi:hypothetical protein HOK51_00625 [Candidatus Woesearchaeota archaeon]|jgi:hypothetical protein|nr:hypothetical protein [Candidatus Woesearchaeota archaeon]MBT6518318.1 hypothetical protein [Candidatus Woesearchaeota archaeon]MBT7366615.1 hypothetical protein [Candidatus Woesearchaeota archaeon]